MILCEILCKKLKVKQKSSDKKEINPVKIINEILEFYRAFLKKSFKRSEVE